MMHRNHISLVLFVAVSLASLGSSSTVDARRVTPGRRRRRQQQQMQSSGRQFLRQRQRQQRQRHLKQEEDENEDGNYDDIEYDAITKRSDEVKTSVREDDNDDGGGEEEEEEEEGVNADKKDKESSSKTAAPTAGPTIGAANSTTDTTTSAVSRTIGDVEDDDNSNSNSTQTTSPPTTLQTNTTNTATTPSPANSNSTSSPSPTASPTVETYDCYENNPCLDAAERQVHYYSHADPTKFVQCGAAATCFTMNCHEGLVWSLEDTACVIPATASP